MSQSDTIIAAAAAYLVIRNSKRKSPRWWRRDLFVDGHLSRERFFTRISSNDQSLFKNFTRMSMEDFQLLLEKVSPIIQKQDTNYRDSISPKDRLLITLRYLATGDSYASLMFRFEVSQPSITRIIPETCTALIQVLNEYVKIPKSENEWREVAQDFSTTWNYPHCVGALDGKHVVIIKPENSGSMFFNYKGTFSIVLMALADANYSFLFANVGCQGRISDGGVFKNTSLYQNLVENKLGLPPPEPLRSTGGKPVPYVIVADDAFALEPNLMKPYPGHHQKGSKERVYNYRHSRARRVVENTFGILAAVFRVFGRPMAVSVTTTELVTTACIYLHNFLRASRSSRHMYAPPGSFDCDNKDGTTTLGSWRMAVSEDTGLLPLQKLPRKPSPAGKEVREEFADHYLTTEGRVLWQYDY